MHAVKITYRDAGVAVALLVAEVPQVDGQLTQLVVPQVTVSQQDAKQREGESTLAAHVLQRK